VQSKSLAWSNLREIAYKRFNQKHLAAFRLVLHFSKVTQSERKPFSIIFLPRKNTRTHSDTQKFEQKFLKAFERTHSSESFSQVLRAPLNDKKNNGPYEAQPCARESSQEEALARPTEIEEGGQRGRTGKSKGE